MDARRDKARGRKLGRREVFQPGATREAAVRKQRDVPRFERGLQEEYTRLARDTGIARFQVNLTGAISWKDLPNHGAFIIATGWPYDPERGQVAVGNLAELKRKLRALKRDGATDVWVFTAKTIEIMDAV